MSLHTLTGIRDERAARRYLRRKWNLGHQRTPIERRPGHRFYVTARRGRDVIVLLGPYVSHMSACDALPRARRRARLLHPEWTGFYSFGTMSSPAALPTRFGR